ncbi:hypothetical protein DFH07DRAFT_252485 [Mycena maculata]|uniref:Protein kinase domain-containing protein n=1 Tax=Mycena maculata TaxID=230809 RepID=A0AAD7HR25_9AGAR|nr:hypothetical protein DFH07DRAFT_252485 [Mycena maculata]
MASIMAYTDGPERTQTLGVFGQDKTVPELSDTILYNPFKVDIYQLGNVFVGLIINHPALLEGFHSLSTAMTWLNPERPTAAEAVADFEIIHSSMVGSRRADAEIIPSVDGSSISGDSDSGFELVSESGSSDGTSLDAGSYAHSEV